MGIWLTWVVGGKIDEIGSAEMFDECNDVCNGNDDDDDDDAVWDGYVCELDWCDDEAAVFDCAACCEEQKKWKVKNVS